MNAFTCIGVAAVTIAVGLLVLVGFKVAVEWLRRRRIPRISGPKRMQRNRAIERELRRLDARFEADARAEINRLVKHLDDTNTTDH